MQQFVWVWRHSAGRPIASESLPPSQQFLDECFRHLCVCQLHCGSRQSPETAAEQFARLRSGLERVVASTGSITRLEEVIEKVDTNRAGAVLAIGWERDEQGWRIYSSKIIES
jgi:hypothetical protein